VSWT